MKWDIARGRYQRSTYGTTRVHLYYYVKHVGVRNYVAGRYWDNREIDYGRLTFTTPGQARKHCERLDENIVVLTSQS